MSARYYGRLVTVKCRPQLPLVTSPSILGPDCRPASVILSAPPVTVPSGAMEASTKVSQSHLYWNALPTTCSVTRPGCGHARLPAWHRVLVRRYSPSVLSAGLGGGCGGDGGGGGFAAQPESTAQSAAMAAARIVSMASPAAFGVSWPVGYRGDGIQLR